jgi:hypothetical protein
MFGLKYPSVRWRACLALPAIAAAIAAYFLGHPLLALAAAAGAVACLTTAFGVWREIES